MQQCSDDCYPHQYQLQGPQVEPAAGLWQYCAKLCIVPIERLTALTDDPKDPHFFPPYPTDDKTIKEEFAELVELAEKRDDPCFLAEQTPCPKTTDVCEFSGRELPRERCRRPISKLWNFCPYPPGAVLVNRFPGEQVIRTGRGLARAVESETPGLYHRHVADFLMRTRNWSPPRQALVWAALDVAVASALQAAWYYKWVAAGREKKKIGCTAFRERPYEYAKRIPNGLNKFNVLFDHPDEFNPVPMQCPQPSPGTPRHPAYPSGHSTYSAAASEILKFFFGAEETPAMIGNETTLADEFDNLADNIGLGRMWAGVHWRSDHTAGQRLGRTVACLVLSQLRNMSAYNIMKKKVASFDLCPLEPKKLCDPCREKEKCSDERPPLRSDLCAAIEKIESECAKHNDYDPPTKPCAPPPSPCPKKDPCHQDNWNARVDAYRGPQQGGGTP
jgi:membrane-associated phospholipid phosphatase